VTLAWETVSEQDNAGFNVLRGETADGPWVQVNATMIPAATPGSSEGHSYTWGDPLVLTAGQTVYYLLEDVDFSGVAAQHGPVSVTADAVAAPAGPNAVRLSGFGAAAGAFPFALPLAGLALAAAGAAGARGLRRRK
jgi:hypothetical protein